MKKKILLPALMFVTLPMPVYAFDFDLSFQPRFKTGVQYYEYQQDAFQSPARDPQGIFPNMQSSLEFKDWLPYVGGGLTIFANRFFVDIDVQHAFNGEDQTFNSQQNFLEGDGSFSSGTVLVQNPTNYDTNFDRTEWSISAGFSVFEKLVLFAGYKHAETNFDSNLRGNIAGLQASNSAPIPFLSGTLTGNLEQNFKYDGPFVGASYSWRIDQEVIAGTLSFNFAAAFMDGTVDLRFRDIVLTNQTGATVPFDLQNVAQSQGRGSFSGLKGDSTGFSFGAAWRGLTSVDDLTYSFGVNGYLYEFDSNDSNNTTPDFSETQVRLNFSLAYAF